MWIRLWRFTQKAGGNLTRLILRYVFFLPQFSDVPASLSPFGLAPPLSPFGLVPWLTTQRTGGTWSSETVDGSAGVGQYSSLALDSGGNPHVSYYRAGGGLLYASRSGGQWQIQLVQDGWMVGAHTALALNAFDQPRIAYADDDYRALRYTYPPAQVFLPVLAR